MENKLTIGALLASADKLPSLPEICLRASEQLEDESVKVQQIGETVQNDAAISSRILRMVNSAYYGLPNHVSSIAQAVQLLGRQRLKQILIGSVLSSVFQRKPGVNFPAQEFWQHSIKTAIIARKLAEDIEEIAEPESLFTAGILHDIGQLIMLDKAFEAMNEAKQMANNQRISILEAESQLTGVNHAEVGEALIRHWGLPEILSESVAEHHTTDHQGKNKEAAHILYLANCLAESVPPIDEDETREMLSRIPGWQMDGISLELVAEACQQADEMAFQVMENLGMVDMEIAAD